MLHPNPAVVQTQRAARVRDQFFHPIAVSPKARGSAAGSDRAKTSQFPTKPAGNLDVHNSLFFKRASKKTALTLGPASSKKLRLKPPPAARGGVG